MELYYYVYQFTKRKGCKFRFYYYKNNGASCIFGDVTVELDNNAGRIIRFDPAMALQLSNKEKTSIASTVLKYIYL